MADNAQTNDVAIPMQHPPLFFEKPRRALTVAKTPAGSTMHTGAQATTPTGDALVIDWRAFFDTAPKNNSTAHGNSSPGPSSIILEASNGMNTLGISWYAWLAYCVVMTMILTIVIVVGVFMFR